MKTREWMKGIMGGAAVLAGVDGAACAGSPEPWEESAERMVREQIEARGVSNPAVLDAMRRVPRHSFVPEVLRSRAYADDPLPIGHGQTISQPYIVGLMTELLDPQPGDRILDVGTGSGYQAAVLAKLAKTVVSIEIVPELAAEARERLAALGYANVEVITGDGYAGIPDRAPWDGILVAAAPDHVPPALVEQLAVGARLLIPVGDHNAQVLRVIERTEEGIQERSHLPVRFVPLTRTGEPAAER